jgi:hypothetical protein
MYKGMKKGNVECKMQNWEFKSFDWGLEPCGLGLVPWAYYKGIDAAPGIDY